MKSGIRSLTVGLCMAVVCMFTGPFVATVLAQQPADVTPRPTRMNTFFGPTGLLTVPTAYVTPRGEAQFGMAMTDDARSISANYGIANYAEVGAAYVDRDGRSNKAIVSAKINVIPANIEWFELGLGVIDPFDEIGDSYYVVASTNLYAPPAGLEDRGVAVRAHLGYGTRIFSSNPIGGLEFWLDRRFAIVGEYNGDTVNGAIRYVHGGERFRIQAGILDSDFFVSTTYALDF